MSYTVQDSTIARVSGTTLKMLREGDVTITATQAGSAAFEAAAPVTVSVTVSPLQTITGSARVQLTLLGDLNDPGLNETELVQDITLDIATATGVEETRITVIALLEGSIIVVFDISPPLPGSSELRPASEIAADIVAQAADPSSPLVAQGTVTSMIDTSSAVVAQQRCPNGELAATCPEEDDVGASLEFGGQILSFASKVCVLFFDSR